MDRWFGGAGSVERKKQAPKQTTIQKDLTAGWKCVVNSLARGIKGINTRKTRSFRWVKLKSDKLFEIPGSSAIDSVREFRQLSKVRVQTQLIKFKEDNLVKV